MLEDIEQKESTLPSSSYHAGAEADKQRQRGNTAILCFIGLVMFLIVLFATYSSKAQIKKPAPLTSTNQQIQDTGMIDHQEKHSITLQKVENQSNRSKQSEKIDINQHISQNESSSSQPSSKIYNQSAEMIQKNPTNVQDKNMNCTEFSILKHSPIWGGEIYYARIPQEYWQHRLQMIKSLGFNTVSVSIFWNHHELSRGVFDFSNNEKNLTGFLKLTQKYGMNIFLKPGPYVGGAWDFGGLPARLLGIKDLVIRSSSPAYEEEVYLYFSQLSKIIKPFLEVNGGNIILIQIQNELGSLNSDKLHTTNLLKMWKNLQIQSNFNFLDYPKEMEKHYWPGASFAIKGDQSLEKFQLTQKSNLFKGQLIYGQVSAGTQTYWAQPWNKTYEGKFLDSIDNLISHNKSFILHFLHGGSNFGLTAGAKWATKGSYNSAITSFDNHAPISEQGLATNTYHQLRKKMEKITETTALIQPSIPAISVSEFNLSLQAQLMLSLPPPEHLPSLGFFEDDTIKMYHQGIVVYETQLLQKREYLIKILLHDFGIIYVDDQYFQNITRRQEFPSSIMIKCERENCNLKILVQAMGHASSGNMQSNDKKGLISFEIENSTQKLDWKIYRTQLNNTSILSWFKTSQAVVGPSLQMGSFQITELGDMYFNMEKFVKGYLWINGKLLGRYWNLDQPMRLFCPGVWLKKGQNQVRVLELSENKSNAISSKI